ncbi:MAG: TPM domain-containing protein [Ignavibacteriaceae bacterium]|nr:TPM domain-containing protein [Ignavibacteriaceae bacterium]
MFRLLLCSLLILWAELHAVPQVPKLKLWATDLTGTLSSSELDYLNSRLKTFQDSTSNQLVFLMIPSLEGDALEDYTYRVAKENLVGDKDRDNGVLLFVSKEERKIRIEVGYGLEGALPDATSSYIIRKEIVPLFKTDNYFQGIVSGLDAIMKATAGEYKAMEKKKKGSSGLGKFVPILLMIIFGFLSRRRRRSVFFGGGPRIGGFPGGFGGGGFGGFSGGGGSFGGGGASGSW